MLIRNAKDSAGKAIEVWLRDGKCAAGGRGLLVPEGEEVLDAKGRTAWPAFIDTHFHWRTPGFEYKEDISTGSAAAAAGGYTFVNLMPNTKPVCSSAEIAHAVEAEAARVGLCDANQTVSITKDFDWSETENNRLLFEMTAKYGTPYFSNYINSDMKPSDVRSMCCRLRLDLRELRKKSGGFFGSGESTGSVGVVTINMPRIAYLAKDKKDFYDRLDHMMDIAARSLKTKRTVITKLLDAGLYPYTKRYQGTFKNHFSTIGLIGMNEVGLNANWLRKDLTHPETLAFTKEVLTHMRERLKDYQEQYGDLYNLEATPAEGTTHRFAREDQKRYPDIIQAGPVGQRYYTNSSQLPVDHTSDLFRALQLQDELQCCYTGGTVFHMYMNEAISSPEACRDIVRKVLTRFRMPYLTVTPLFSVCEKHGYLRGEHEYCPFCDEELLHIHRHE